jgi:hypothetical protein
VPIGIAAAIAELPDLAQQSAAGQLGERSDPLPQIRRERRHFCVFRSNAITEFRWKMIIQSSNPVERDH